MLAVVTRSLLRRLAHRAGTTGRASAIFALGVCLLVVAPVLAQYGRTFESIEWAVARSDAIVRGKVQGLSLQPIKNQDGWLQIELRVSETIKGKNTDKITFATWSTASDELLNQMKKSQHDALWFLTRDKTKKTLLVPSGTEAVAPTELVPATDEFFIELIKSHETRVRHWSPPPLFSMDLTLLKQPDEIVQAARSAVKEQGVVPPIRSHGINISHATAAQTGSPGDVNALTVPVAARLESIARLWISAPEKVADRLDVGQVKDKKARDSWLASERDQLREEGVKALKYFPSDENIILLRSLLNDPTWILEDRDRDGVEVTNKVYPIRKAAYAILKKWEVDVERPHISEPAPYDKISAAAQPQRATITSSDDWRTRIVESEGLALSVSLPATVTPEHVPLQLSIFNRGRKVAQVGETGYCLDCKIALKTEDGRVWKLTRLGEYIFGARENGGQYAFVRLRQDKARRWEYDLAEAFEKLTPGKYRLTLEAKVEFRNNVSGEFSDTKTLVAKDLQFQVKEASKSR